MKNIDSEFFDKWDKIVSEAGDYQGAVEFVKSFFNKELGIDDIEDSVIELGKMRSKTLYYLLLSLIIDYRKKLEGHNMYCQDFLTSGDSKTVNDSKQEYNK